LIACRKLLISAGAFLVCAPAIVRAASLMPVRGVIFPIGRNWYGMVPCMCLCWALPAIKKYQDAGLLAQIAHTLNKREVGYDL